MKRLAVITGASRGIGRAAAARFMAEGDTVWNLSRTPCDLEGVVNHACDLGDTQRLGALLRGFQFKDFTRITLVHNAATARPDTYATLKEKDFLKVLALNVVAPQCINRHIVPQMPAGSSVIFIGSLYSHSSAPCCLSYTVSKHALAGMMKSLCQDTAGKSIHTCLIAPGYTDTQLLKEVAAEIKADIAQMQGRTAFGRLLSPEEIAELIFFCSRNPSINGSILNADLGHA